MRAKLRNYISWLSICTLVLSLVLFVIPHSMGEVRVSSEEIVRNGNESWSLILLGFSLIGFALHWHRKTGN